MAKPESKRSSPEPREFSDAHPFDELQDMETDLFDAGIWSSSEDNSKKEGLPHRYKMRHDAHYVDELLSTKPARQAIRLPIAQISGASGVEPDVERLADSIAEFGMLQPLIVRRRNRRYELVAGAKRLAAAKMAGLAEVPCWLYDVDDEKADKLREATNLIGSDENASTRSDDRPPLTHVLPLLGQSFQNIHSCLRQLNESGDPIRSRDAIGQIRAEAQRAACLAWGAMLLRSTPTLMLTDFDAAAVLEEVFYLYDKEPTRTKLNLVTDICSPCVLRSDRRLVFVAMRGALDAILPMARRGQSAEVAVRLSRNGPSRTVELQFSQDVDRPPDSAWGLWFDLQWRERPGGIASGIGLLAAKRATELHGGSISILPSPSPGCALTLSFPEEVSAAPIQPPVDSTP